ncbi:3-oxoacyl-[acyl-carrier-protein] reductase FabG [Elysia marginata]|uniref:3-oxoacyl-[acyl-carrier-protein] reductase FabG n=1 Tax=Elysia marginata TaxID=1093978 RepID=A0AAV4F2M3_9GAST|nr:3-oxoacyl-[acyl-carrier-protein] reductase FabG [Elysia marginata]
MALETWNPEAFDKSMDCNIRSVIALIQKAVPHLEKTKGNIVCVSSLATQVVAKGQINYQISKAALDHMVRCLALQLGPKGIRINATNPTFVNNTRVMRDATTKWKSLDTVMEKVYRQETPLQGQFSGLDEQAEVILFLASNAARFIHGQCILVDGGIGLKGNPFNFDAVYKHML